MKYRVSRLALAAFMLTIMSPTAFAAGSSNQTFSVDQLLSDSKAMTGNTAESTISDASVVASDSGELAADDRETISDDIPEASDDNLDFGAMPTIVEALPREDSVRSKKGWLAEQLAITAFGDSLQYWQAAQENGGSMPIDTRNNLADIGRTYTSNDLPTLGELADFLVFAKKVQRIEDSPIVYAIGDVFDATQEKEFVKKTVKGVFTTYYGTNTDITVYTGPDQSRLDNNQLRGQGATYFYPTGTITNIHTTDKGYLTVRDIGIGNSRMELIFAYGSPNAIWRDGKNESYIFLYEGHREKEWSKKEGFLPTVENINNNSQSTTAIDKQKSYIAFTIKHNNIEAIDFIDGQVWSRFGLPKADMYDVRAGQMTDDDFVLRGLRLNETFVNDANSEWRTQGMLFGSSFIGYNEYGVSVDHASLINRVLLNIYTPTRRGIALGDTKYLLLFVYGMPTRIVESTTDVGTATVYEYKHPRSNNTYLQFALDDKNQYIKSVMLSDRPVK